MTCPFCRISVRVRSPDCEWHWPPAFEPINGEPWTSGLQHAQWCADRDRAAMTAASNNTRRRRAWERLQRSLANVAAYRRLGVERTPLFGGAL